MHALSLPAATGAFSAFLGACVRHLDPLISTGDGPGRAGLYANCPWPNYLKRVYVLGMVVPGKELERLDYGNLGGGQSISSWVSYLRLSLGHFRHGSVIALSQTLSHWRLLSLLNFKPVLLI